MAEVAVSGVTQYTVLEVVLALLALAALAVPRKIRLKSGLVVDTVPLETVQFLSKLPVPPLAPLKVAVN
jgi:uncharacterized membrane protein YkgB